MQRDARLDVVRGWLQLSIFASHAFGSWIGVWLIHRAWGLTDSSEQFVFLSGLTLGSVFDHKLSRYGWRAAIIDMLLRTARLYRTHLVVLAGFLLIMLAIRFSPTLSPELAGLRWTFWFHHPVQATLGALAFLYQPAFMDILPIFIFCLLVLPGFSLLLNWFGTTAVLLSLVIYAAVQLSGLGLPWIGDAAPGFNVLAWQVLFMIGAWLGRATRRGEWPLRGEPMLVVLAVLAIVAGLLLRLAQYDLVPWRAPAWLDMWLDKRELSPLRLVHALALAYLVAWLVPRDARWMRLPFFRLLAAVGRNSLNVFCVGLLLSWGASVVFQMQPYSMVLDAVLIGSGVVILAVYAMWLERRQLRPNAGNLATDVRPVAGV